MNQRLVTKLSVGLLVSASVLLTSSAIEAQKFTPSGPPPAGKMLVYVYRQRSMVGAATHPIIFANRDFLADLHNGNYAPIEVPQGRVVITSPGTIDRGGPSPFPHGFASGSGCAGLDWRHLGARREDVVRCEGEVREASAALAQASRGGLPELYDLSAIGVLFQILSGKLNAAAVNRHLAAHPDLQERVVRVCGPFPLKLNRCQFLLRDALLGLNPSFRLEIEGKGGETYYVKWSAGSKMKPVDAATGAKEISGLHLAKDR